MTVEIAPGPASMGTPSGMMPTSSFSIPSAFSTAVSRCWLRRAWTMSSAFRPISTPPAILKAPIVMPNRRKMRRSEEHTSELQSRLHLVCRLLLEKKKKKEDNKQGCDEKDDG